MGTMTTSTAHQTDQSRFVITVDGEEAGFAEYADTATTREFNHTVIHDAYQGQGLSKTLIQAALDDESTAARQVIPTCSAVAGFIEKNPDYQPLTTREGNL
ncbi:N-acetyltransferase [Corynebacterium sp. FDAARGOS 1242]|mgnify:FL=1|uniref:Acetyltransferase n=1 Tax=Corynebacterium minutissimum TaxID=38301 RepID=A0A376D2M8_9CORY|nr:MULTISPECIES: GNAT family N-acetyltransferase [Corynebacterium]QRP61687.1 N-acetyltransferase [Corynebacterium minutissimum]QRP98134.1 N-acetyltransferase [Corynebacterium sp. FDAARGOS 1242]STC80780.1 Acetyltransferase [Corynebacterium minutissimum]